MKYVLGILLMCLFTFSKANAFEPISFKELRQLSYTDLVTFTLSNEWKIVPGAPSGDWTMTIPETAHSFYLDNRLLNLDTCFPEAKFTLGADAVVYNEIIADSDGIMTLGIGCDWFFEAYCNGTLCYSTLKTGNIEGVFAPSNHPMFMRVKKGKNLLAVHVRRGSYTWTFTCGPVPFNLPDTAEFRCGPWLANPDYGTITIRFAVYGDIAAGIQYRKKGEELWSTQWDSIHGTLLIDNFHEFILTGLENGVDYEYRALLVDPVHNSSYVYSPIFSFSLPRLEQDSFSFIYVADLQLTADKQPAMLDRMLNAARADSCDFFVLGGDIGSSLNEGNILDNLFPVFCKHGADHIPLVSCRGNHELKGKTSKLYPKFYNCKNGLPYDVFRFGNTAFLVLDTMDEINDTEIKKAYLRQEADFLKQALANSSWNNSIRKIVLAHGAPYSRYESPAGITQAACELTDAYFKGHSPKFKLNLWLAAHTHIYSRSIPGTSEVAALTHQKKASVNGIDYTFPVLTVVGPGTEQPQENSIFRIDVTKDSITVCAFFPDGTCFDKIVIDNDGAIHELLPIPHFDPEKE